MIFKNELISANQVKKMIILEGLGFTTLLSAKISINYSGRDGIFCIILAGIFTYIFAAVILFLCDKCEWKFYDFMRKYGGRKLTVLVSFLFLLKYLALSIVCSCYFIKVVREEIMGEASVIMILIPLIILALYVAVQGIEAKGRLSQFIFYIVLVPIAVAIILSLKGVDKYYLSPLFMAPAKSVIRGGIWLFMLFSPVELLLFSSESIDASDYKKIKEIKKAVYSGITIVLILNIIFFLLSVGKFGINYINFNKNQSSLIRLISDISISGLFFQRQGGVFLIFFLISMFLAIGALIYYSGFIIYKMSRQSIKKSFVNIAVVIIIAAGILTVIKFDNTYEEARKVSEERLEINNRIYSDAILINRVENMYEITFVFPHIQDGESYNYTCHEKRIYDAIEKFNSSSDKNLDISHTQVVLLSDDIVKNESKYQEVIDFLWDLSSNTSKGKKLSNNVLIVTTASKTDALTEVDSKLTNSLGKYISDMFINNNNADITNLHDLMLIKTKTEKAAMLCNIIANNDRLEYDGKTIVDENGFVEYYKDNSLAIMELVSGHTGKIISIGSNNEYEIDKNDFYVRTYIIGKNTIQAKIIYTGKLIPIEDGELTDEQLNDILENLIYEKISVLKDNYNCDYLNIYKYLAIDNRKIWAQYLSNPSAIYPNVYIEIEARFET